MLLEPLMTIGTLLAGGAGTWLFSRQLRAMNAAAKARAAKLTDVAALLNGHVRGPQMRAIDGEASEAHVVAHIGGIRTITRLGASAGATPKWTVEVPGRTAGPDITWDSPTARLSLRARLLTGDPAFDAEVVLRGQVWSTLACLDAKRRAAILAVVKRGASNDGKGWKMSFAEHDATPEVAAEMARMLAIASPDWDAPDPGARIAELVRHDPCEGVRVALLVRLLTADARGLAWGTLLAQELAARGGRSAAAALRSARADEVVAGAFVLQQEGTAADLPALREAADRAEGAVATALQAAITAIVSRAAPSAAGLLSLSAALDEGALSRAADGGEVSAARPPFDRAREAR